MIEWWQAVALGTVQGLTEFLPISSSGHLILVPRLFGWADPGLTFDVALHMGTLLAVVTYYAKTWVGVATGQVSRSILYMIILATIPAAILGYFGESLLENSFRSELLVAGNIVIFGVVLWIADRLGRRTKDLSSLTKLDALIIGLSQALALIPGVSRSGITMSAALLRGVRREDAANFSFLLSTPIIAGAGVFKLRNLGNVPPDQTLIFAAGVIASAIFGFISIKFLLNYLKRENFDIFVYYRLVVGIGLITIFLLRTAG